MSKIIKASQIIGKYELFNGGEVNEYLREKSLGTEESSLQKIAIDKDYIKDEKNEIIANAQEKAKKIIDEAQEERQLAEKLKKEAYQTGLQQGKEEGYDLGYQEGLQEAQEFADTLKKALNKFNIQVEQRMNELKSQLIKLSTKIADIIVSSELNINPDLINNIVEDLLVDLGENHQNLLIKVHPEMFHYIDKDKFEEKFFKDNLEFAADSLLSKGDCIVETNFGGKDAIISDKLQVLKEKLYQEAGLHEES